MGWCSPKYATAHCTKCDCQLCTFCASPEAAEAEARVKSGSKPTKQQPSAPPPSLAEQAAQRSAVYGHPQGRTQCTSLPTPVHLPSAHC